MNQVSLHKDGTVSFFNASRGRVVRDCIVPTADLLAMTPRDQKRVEKHLAQYSWLDDPMPEPLDFDELRAAAEDDAETFGREAF